jgi:Protein of unknown function (DUF2911)
MNKIYLSALFLLSIIPSFSQDIFPDLSSKGSIEQRVGFTMITVEYERPSARGRKIFGELVPYNTIWRTGAGNCTRIGFSTNVTIEGKSIEAGKYSLLTIPTEGEWTIILNSDTTLYRTSSYDKNKDVIRFNVKSEATSRYYESFTIDIDVVPHNAELYLSWEKSQIHFAVDTGADCKTTEFIEQNLLTGKSVDADQYATAAEYYFYLNKELSRAVTLIDKAILIKKEPWYYRLKIDILEKQKKYPEAIVVLNSLVDGLPKMAREKGWSTATLQKSAEENKSRIETLKKKLTK